MWYEMLHWIGKVTYYTIPPRAQSRVTYSGSVHYGSCNLKENEARGVCVDRIKTGHFYHAVSVQRCYIVC